MRYLTITLGQLISLFFLLVSLVYAENAEYRVNCPEKISLTQQVTQIQTGWRTFVAEPYHYLNNVSFYSGKPEEQASLKPETSNSDHATWTFSSSDQIYVACEYNQTNIQYTKPLNAQTKHCIIQYDKFVHSSSGGLLPKKIQCY